MDKILKQFDAALAEENVSRTQWAESNGINKSTIHLFTKGRRPNDMLLAKLATAWSRPEIGLEILKAHLIDEIERTGLNIDSIEPVIKGHSPAPELDRDLDLLREFLHKEPDLRAVIHKLADTAKLAMGTENQPTLQKKKLTQEEEDELNALLEKSKSKPLTGKPSRTLQYPDDDLNIL
jgi:hypothetical protein